MNAIRYRQYPCPECGKGTIRPTRVQNYKTRIKGQPFVVDEAVIGICDQCGEKTFNAKEIKRWGKCYQEAIDEHWFSGWEATPEEQRVKFINIAQHVVNYPNYQTQVVDNKDVQNRRLAMEKLIQDAISKERRRELDLYKHYANDPEFKRAFDASIMRMLTEKDVFGGLQSELSF